MNNLDKADERLVLVDELIQVLDSHDSEMVAHDLMKVNLEAWDNVHAAVNNQIKANIKALTEERDVEFEKIEAASAAKSSNLTELEQKKGAAEGHVEEVSQQVATLHKKLEECQKDADDLQQKYLKVKEETTQDLASLRYMVNLYSHITNIRWQYDADPEDIRGYVCNKNNVKPFQLNTKQNSRYFIASYLWDLLDA